ncbi:hypothetical protein Tco_1050817 [Tanacetum coccineum]|uniref:Uncharacterized protein n=1 Tax=Tanacetum coccineum TaxID=301880 RepID=A0ABQ5BB19_9ASTR
MMADHSGHEATITVAGHETIVTVAWVRDNSNGQWSGLETMVAVALSTYRGPSLSNDGEKRKDGGKSSNLVATSSKADTHLALALNENPHSNRVV